VQAALAQLVPKVRQVRYAIMWNDRILTFWLVAALTIVSVVLMLIPWGFLIQWTMRLIGLAAFGPHMHLIGRYIDRTRAETRQTEMQYREAGSADKQKILDAYREELMKEARVQVKKAQDAMAKASDREKERFAYLGKLKYVFLNRNTHGNANIKYIASADPFRSTVCPAPSAAGDAPAPSAASAASAAAAAAAKPKKVPTGGNTDLV